MFGNLSGSRKITEFKTGLLKTISNLVRAPCGAISLLSLAFLAENFAQIFAKKSQISNVIRIAN